MASARNEGSELWGGGVPWRRKGWGGAMPLPRIFVIFELKMASFGAFWELILLQLNCLTYTHKLVSLLSLDFGL